MAFSSLTRSRIFTLSHHSRIISSSTFEKIKPTTQSSRIEEPKFHSGRVSGLTFNPNLLLVRTASKGAHSSSNFGYTQMKFSHGGRPYNINQLRNYSLISNDNLGSLVNNNMGKTIMASLVLGSCVYMLYYICNNLFYLCLGNWETIPYIKRKHFVPSTDLFDIWLSKVEFENDMTKYKSCILPLEHPISQRIFNISKNLIEALEKDLELEKGSMALSYASSSTPTKEKLKKEKKPWHVQILERKHGKSHLNGMQWEIVVVDKPDVVSAYALHGKVLIYTGLLKICKTDDELATIIAHEMGHAVAKHGPEKLMMKTLPLVTKYMILAKSKLLTDAEAFKRVNERMQKRKIYIKGQHYERMEFEADRIGQMMMASAGYDPQKAPNWYENLGLEGENVEYHYSFLKRKAKLLTESMPEAMAVYNKMKAGHED